MIKYLVLIAVIAAVIWFISKGAQARAARRAQADARPVQDMVRCAHCGVFQPKTDSFEANGRYFCSREHERLH